MVRYSKPVWRMVEEAATELEEFTAKDVKEFIKNRYLDENVNELTIGAQVIACSVNHPSAHHYPDKERFLFYLGNGRFRIASPEERVSSRLSSRVNKASVEFGSEEGRFAQIRNGQIRIPRLILVKMSLENYDFLAFAEDGKGNILLKKAELRIIE